MKLVVGLGNPGSKYQGTRHNVGFMVAALLAQQAGGEQARHRFDADTVEVSLAGERVLLVCPLTYMNLSGKSVLAARDFYKIPNDSILVVCDDFNLPLGRLRLRPGGSAGGQKGLQNIIQRLGTQQIPRLRLGIGPVPASWNPADFVLGKFTKQEQPEVELMVAQAADAVRLWCQGGMQAAMNRFNSGPEREPRQKKERPSPSPAEQSSQENPPGEASGQGPAANPPGNSPT
jgi:PTH1 family peptidyl-tRNA hydrolase